MRTPRTGLFVFAGLLMVLGASGSLVMFLQPWRSCPEIDDSSAGCPATGIDSALLGLALTALVLGVVLALAAAPRYPKVTGEFAAPFGPLDPEPSPAPHPAQASERPAPPQR